MREPTSGPVARRAARRGAGFTLIELLAAMALTLAIAGLLGGEFRGAVNRAARARACGELAALARAVEGVRLRLGEYPKTEDPAVLYEVLTGRCDASGNVLDPPGRAFFPRALRLRDSDPVAPQNCALDPWGTPYRYIPFNRGSAESTDFILFSCGPDGRAKDGDPVRTGDNAGVPDLAHPDNADNLYAGR